MRATNSVLPPNLVNPAVEKQLHPGGPAFSFQHAGNFARRAVAKKLAPSFLVVGDAMFFDQGNEVGGRVADQRGFYEVRVRREEVLRLGVDVGEITAASAGDQNFLAGTIRTLD